MICENCLYKLELFCEFRDRAARTENLLVDLYKELNASKVQNEQQMVKMNIVTMEHNDLIMVEPHHELLNNHNVNDLDLPPLTHRDNMIVGQEIILTHQNINTHSLDNINLNHDLSSQDLSDHSLQTPSTILVDANGSVHSVRYPEGSLELIRDDQQIFTEQYRLQQRLQLEMPNATNEAMQLSAHVKAKVFLLMDS